MNQRAAARVRAAAELRAEIRARLANEPRALGFILIPVGLLEQCLAHLSVRRRRGENVLPTALTPSAPADLPASIGGSPDAYRRWVQRNKPPD